MPTRQEAISYWKESALKDRQVAKEMIKSKHNDWALFVWHLVLEKLLKGLLVKEGKDVVITHNLFRLATDLEEISFSEEYLDWSKEITTFNLEARYDSYKSEFHKRATSEYVAKWDVRCEEVYKWLLKQY